jgi:hypothetical protein
MAEEKNLWIQLKNNTKSIIWTRIESSTGLGIPDLFGYYKRGFWVELKVIVNNKINFARDPLPKTLKLFSGSIVRDPSSISEKHPLCSIGPGSKSQGWEQLLLMLGAWTPDGRSSTKLH